MLKKREEKGKLLNFETRGQEVKDKREKEKKKRFVVDFLRENRIFSELVQKIMWDRADEANDVIPVLVQVLEANEQDLFRMIESYMVISSGPDGVNISDEEAENFRLKMTLMYDGYHKITTADDEQNREQVDDAKVVFTISP